MFKSSLDNEQFDVSESLVIFFTERKEEFVSCVTYKLYMDVQRKIIKINPKYFTFLEKIIGDHRPIADEQILILLYKAQQKNLLAIYWRHASDKMQLEMLIAIRKSGVVPQDLHQDPLLKYLPNITDRINRCELLTPAESNANVNAGNRERVESVLPPHAPEARQLRTVSPTVANANRGPGFFSAASSALPINPSIASSNELIKKRNLNEMSKEDLIAYGNNVTQICEMQQQKIIKLEAKVKELQDKLPPEANDISTTLVPENKGMTR